MELARRLLRFAGIDRAVAYTVLARGWAGAAGVVNLLFLVAFLQPAEQGYYYTFGSIQGLSVFFELGLGYMLVQFASHEKARLHWTERGTLDGDPVAKARLASLLRRTVAWYVVMAAAAFVCVLSVGWVFFTVQAAEGQGIAWQLPWLLVVTGMGLQVAATPFWAILEGCGLVASMARLNVLKGITSSLLFWLALSQGAGLHAAAIFSGVNVLLFLVWVLGTPRALLIDLWRFRDRLEQVDWRGEVWPLQWRIALSWLSSYFSVQLLNPLIFALAGPEAAGRMGLSMSIGTTITALGMAWISTRGYALGAFVARREFAELDRSFLRWATQTVTIVALGLSAAFVALQALAAWGSPLAERALPALPLACILLAHFVQTMVNALAVFLRAHKEEPLLLVTMANAAATVLICGLLGLWVGVAGIAAGYLIVQLFVALGGSTLVFLRKRREWRACEPAVPLAA